MTILVTAIAASPIFAFIYCLNSYRRALAGAYDTWWMRLGFGQAFLHFSLTRLPRSGIDKAMHAEGRAKCLALAAAPPPTGAIAFVGSSTFTYWRHLEKDMAAEGISHPPCFNAAFGGSWTKHCLQFADALCLDYKPRAVVYTCGSNDINTGQSPSSAAQGFVDFHRALLAALPGTPLVYVPPTVTPYVAWRGEAARCAELSQLVKSYARTLQSGTVVAVVDQNQTAGFESDETLYLGDRHHLNDEGHRRLAKLIAPALRECLDKVQAIGRGQE